VPERLTRLAAQGYLFAGVEIRWRCDRRSPRTCPKPPSSNFPAACDHLPSSSATARRHPSRHRPAGLPEDQGAPNGPVAWPLWSAGSKAIIATHSDADGGSMRRASARRDQGHPRLRLSPRSATSRAKDITGRRADDGVELMLSIFIRNPHFQSQTKDRLTSLEAARFVEARARSFRPFLADNMDRGRALLGAILERMDERLKRRAEREVKRKTATSARKLRLPGKLTDCANDDADGTEMFIVEGDSAGGSAKQARNRKTQAILPIRGKILNVASATADKIRANSEIADLQLALGCGIRDKWIEDSLRYERIIIMTEATLMVRTSRPC
jgi:topoisomerase-4 subunit B